MQHSNYWTYYGADQTGTAQAAAISAASANGISASDVTVNIPLQSGPYAGTAGYVEILVQSNLTATLGQIITNNNLIVAARSVARGLPMQIGMIMLQPSGANAFPNNALAFTLVNAPLIVNSSDPSAYTQAGFGIIYASQYDITGGYVNSGGTLIEGPVYTQQAPVPDPLEFLPIPTTTGVTVRSTSLMSINSLLPVTLQPGIYQGGLDIKGASTVVMQPGIYIMQGGGFTVEGLATVAGLNVMVYNTTSTSYAAGSISITSVGKVTLTAPTSGTYQGISFFQEHSLTNPIAVSGVGLAVITGTVYTASAPVSLTGLATTGQDTLGGAYVVNSMQLQGIGAFNVNPNINLSLNINLGILDVSINLTPNPPRVPDVRLVQ